MLVVPIAFGLIAVALVSSGIPLARGRIAPNTTYGLRTGETLADDDVWYAANRRTGRDLIALGSALAVWAAVNLWWHPFRDPDLDVLLSTGILVLGAFGVAIRGILFGIRYKQSKAWRLDSPRNDKE